MQVKLFLGLQREKWASKVLRKNTPYAAQVAGEDASKEAHDFGLRRVRVFVKGPGAGRESAIRSIHNSGIEVMEIIDVTPLTS